MPHTLTEKSLKGDHVISSILCLIYKALGVLVVSLTGQVIVEKLLLCEEVVQVASQYDKPRDDLSELGY